MIYSIEQSVGYCIHETGRDLNKYTEILMYLYESITYLNLSRTFKNRTFYIIPYFVATKLYGIVFTLVRVAWGHYDEGTRGC